MESCLYVKLEKSEFHVTKVSFLGFNVSKGTLAMAKICAVLDWPRPFSLNAVQRFLGLANIFRRFVQKTPGPFSLDDQQAFEELTGRLTTVPVLQLPNPRALFIIKVDVFNVGVGAVLSQQSGIPNKLRSCAYYPHRLMPVETNYDVGKRELLAIELALEEWRHWLEVGEHPFVILTDHKNLAYIKQAKLLNPSQVCWSLFFGWFDLQTGLKKSQSRCSLPSVGPSRILSCQPPVLLPLFAGPWKLPLRKPSDHPSKWCNKECYLAWS
ncbi:hypothetical protein NFI96_002775 [Prochilodus magdalenae]|nr:hypothetical protein NFI96_002775 [Prochilodus magdalenae]